MADTESHENETLNAQSDAGTAEQPDTHAEAGGARDEDRPAASVDAESPACPDSNADDADAADEALRKAEEERDQYKDALIRERADFENYKKRTAANSAAVYANGVEHAVLKFLPVLDNFERALASGSTDKAFADGMNMIMRQMQNELAALDVEEIETTGTFDPNIHHAVQQVEVEGVEPNGIAETLQKGYRLNGKVLRPALVKVNK